MYNKYLIKNILPILKIENSKVTNKINFSSKKNNSVDPVTKFDVNIELASDQLHDISITGVINAVDLDGVLTTLAILSKRSYRFEKETYIFY